MKPSTDFKQVIQAYLEQRAKDDELFAASYAKPNKNIDECTNHIFQTVRKSGCTGHTDDEVFGMAVHYYDEDDIKNVKPINCRVVINRSMELSEEEKKQARQTAIEKEIEEQRAAMKKKPAKRKTETDVQQMSLF